MLRKAIRHILLGVCILASIALFALPLLPPRSSIQLYSGYHGSHYFYSRVGTLRVGLAIAPYTTCSFCGTRNHSGTDQHEYLCPRYKGNAFGHYNQRMGAYEKWLRVPGLAIGIDKDVNRLMATASWYYFSALFAIYPTIYFLRRWRTRRRIPPGHCPKCSYNLTGNTSGVCPECGTTINTAPVSDSSPAPPKS